jgi:hypothetical protein
LQNTWILGGRNLAKGGISVAGIDGQELGVIKGVETLHAELEDWTFRPRGQIKGFEKSNVEIIDPRASDGVLARVAKPLIRTPVPWSHWRREGSGVEKLFL